MNLDYQVVLPLIPKFLNAAPIIEVGCGNGHFLVQEAQKQAHTIFIGCETKFSRVQKTLSRIHKAGLSNAFVFFGQAQELLSQFPPHSLGGVHINFPDPWWKKRYHKRRFFYIQRDVDNVVEKLKSQAFISFISDHEEYFRHVFSLLSYSLKTTPEWEEGYRKGKEILIDSIFSRKWQEQGRFFFQTLFKRN